MQIVRMITGGDECCLLQTIYFTKCLLATCFVLEMESDYAREVPTQRAVNWERRPGVQRQCPF